MARTRSENYDGIHLGILTQAAALFSAQGYMRSSIADLADACKLSRGALYHYFDSKEAILFAILDAHIREMIARVDAAIAEGGPTLTQFRNVIRTIVEVNAKSPHEQRVLIHDLSFLNEDEQQTIKNLERQLVDTVTDLLVRLDAEGKIVKRTRKIYAMVLFGIINYTYTWYDPKGGIGPREFADIAVNLFLNGFAPGDAVRPAPAGRREKV
ncbi:TetR/AcrR family transcriptional regulator [Bradyrhizobium sediminis]|uniref:TetR/AcrR family transcriptional regulator n=1 Tax=Bradyrhizobium sediminis TaxID=2840469 RepID=A0A975RLT5_9BRAD|nr:TetR/AcrR family transcriptional regulator [Bradyrhizobium sediminis]QWG11983.1 TetR/AcrR family transcriptional regulator [Bradyrhizobium sediminis]